MGLLMGVLVAGAGVGYFLWCLGLLGAYGYLGDRYYHPEPHPIVPGLGLVAAAAILIGSSICYLVVRHALQPDG